MSISLLLGDLPESLLPATNIHSDARLLGRPDAASAPASAGAPLRLPTVYLSCVGENDGTNTGASSKKGDEGDGSGETGPASRCSFRPLRYFFKFLLVTLFKSWICHIKIILHFSLLCKSCSYDDSGPIGWHDTSLVHALRG